MSQLVACKTPEGLLIAADRRVETREGAQAKVHLLRKLYPLGPAAALVSGGAAMGIEVSRTLSHLLTRRAALVFEELEPYVVSVFQEKYDAFARKGAEWFAAHPDAPRRSCFLLGARSLDGSYKMCFYASETHADPYRSSPIGSALTMPRRLGLETRLVHGVEANQPAETSRTTILSTLQKIAEVDGAVGGPFDIATFNGSGVHLETV